MRYELNDNELELVNGGTYWQTANDSRFLNSLNGSTDRYGAFKIFIDGSGERTKEIQGRLAQAEHHLPPQRRGQHLHPGLD